MPPGLAAVFVLLAQALPAATSATAKPYGPVAAVPPKPPPVTSDQPQRACAPQGKQATTSDIVVCAVKPEGYRLPPDIVEARRLKKEGVTIRPHNPHESFADKSCANVGPMGCRGTPTLNMLAVAATAAEISKRLAKGQEIGSIFETEKTSSDYQYYELAKKEREEKEAAAAAKAARAKAIAASKVLAPPSASPAPSASAPTPASQQSH